MKLRTKLQRIAHVNSVLETLKENGYFVGFNKEMKCWIAWKRADNGNTFVQCYDPAKTKANFRYSFATQKRAETFLEEWAERKRKSLAYFAERKETKSKPASDFWSVGDVAYNSWGYDQTNVDFYQVTKVKGKSIWLRKIAQNTDDHGQAGGGRCFPRRNEFVDEEFRKVPHGDRCSMYVGSLSKWSGKSLYCSSDR